MTDIDPRLKEFARYVLGLMPERPAKAPSSPVEAPAGSGGPSVPPAADRPPGRHRSPDPGPARQQRAGAGESNAVSAMDRRTRYAVAFSGRLEDVIAVADAELDEAYKIGADRGDVLRDEIEAFRTKVKRLEASITSEAKRLSDIGIQTSVRLMAERDEARAEVERLRTEATWQRLVSDIGAERAQTQHDRQAKRLTVQRDAALALVADLQAGLVDAHATTDRLSGERDAANAEANRLTGHDRFANLADPRPEKQHENMPENMPDLTAARATIDRVKAAAGTIDRLKLAAAEDVEAGHRACRHYADAYDHAERLIRDALDAPSPPLDGYGTFLDKAGLVAHDPPGRVPEREREAKP